MRYTISPLSGCSAARLARFVRDEEAGGSNPLTPTIFYLKGACDPGDTGEDLMTWTRYHVCITSLLLAHYTHVILPIEMVFKRYHWLDHRPLGPVAEKIL